MVIRSLIDAVCLSVGDPCLLQYSYKGSDIVDKFANFLHIHFVAYACVCRNMNVEIQVSVARLPTRSTVFEYNCTCRKLLNY